MPEPRRLAGRAFDISAALRCLAALLDHDEGERCEAAGISVLLRLLHAEAEELAGDLSEIDLQRAA